SENDDTTLVLPVTSLSTTSTLPCNIIESSDQIYCSTQVEKLSNNNNSISLNSLNFLTELNLTDTDLTLQQTEKLKSLLVKY
ncbi:unnamed protein product, partial [Rotaria magnacalcarata]